MNKTYASKLAKKITNKQLFEMLENAKKGINDWKKASSINPQMSKGYSWNLLTKNISMNNSFDYMHKRNLIMEFWDYMPDDLKPKKNKKKKVNIIVDADHNFEFLN